MTWFEGHILAIESSCDETSASVVSGTTILSNIISSQAELHKKWGGVVPEAAARAHVEAILPVIHEALSTAGITVKQLSAVAVTNRPGLVGALSTGVTAAKALALSLQVPLIGVHHLEGHLLSVFSNDAQVPFPHVALVASGGHTELVVVTDFGSYEIVGHTIDDAAGEAFDKSSRVLGLGYPGGKAIEDAAEGGNPTRYDLPRGLSGETCNFSFSGLKTAVLRLVQKEGENLHVQDAAASVQEAICSVLAERTVRACEIYRCAAITLVGGVAANTRLRKLLRQETTRSGIEFFTPEPLLCTDNAAMIGIAASFRLARGETDGFQLETLPSAPLP